MQTQQTQNSFLGPKSYRDFRETGPSAYKGKGVGGGSYLGGGGGGRRGGGGGGGIITRLKTELQNKLHSSADQFKT